MKKLLITSMAAVAIGLYAKADDPVTYSYNTPESFENYNGVENYEGPLFGRQQEKAEAYAVTPGWVTTATPEDGIFTVTNITSYVGAGSHETVSRPITDTPNTKALAIDTSSPLMRTVHTDKGSTNYLNEAVFFDSVVQFTATEAKPTPGEGDKLMVWLYKSEDVSDENKGAFGESIPTNALVVTALNNEDEMEHFLTDMVIEPDSWHRLTIKSFKDADNDDVLFNIWVDTTPVGGNFVSLLNSDDDARNLAGVAFDGKGAVDDLVFTTTDPFAEALYTIGITLNDTEDAVNAMQYSVDGGVSYTDIPDTGKISIPQALQSVKFKFLVYPGFMIEGSTKTAESSEVEGEMWYYWEKEIPVNSITFTDEVGAVEFNLKEDDSAGETSYKLTVSAQNATVNGLTQGDYVASTKFTFTVAASEGYEVLSVKMNDDVLSSNASGEYTFQMPEKDVTITVITQVVTPKVAPGQSVECDSEEAAKKVTITVTDTEAAAAGQAAVIKAVVKYNGNKWVVTAEINTEATGYIPADNTLVEVAQKLTEIANATEDKDGNVTVALSQVTPGLYYSVDVSENLAGENQGFNPGTRTLATSAGTVTLKVSKPKGNSAFFKVVQHLTKQ